MATFTEPNRLSDVLKREFDPFYNRETVDFVASGHALGTVVAINNVSNKYVPYANGGADGAGTAIGVLLETVDTEKQAVILARGPAVVARKTLIGLDATAEGDLAALGIIVRDDIHGDFVAIA